MKFKTTDKWDAVHALINTLLKDKKLYCNNCDLDYDANNTNDKGQWISCCEDPQIGNHQQHLYAVIKQNQYIRNTRANDFASVKDKSIRMGISLPPRFFRELLNAWKRMNHEDMFSKPEDLNTFMKRFKQFRIPEKV